ncbi:hypothetical protein D9M73_116580 [compost metagenome]
MSGTTLKYVRHSAIGFVVWPARYPGLTHREVGRAISQGSDVPRGTILSAGFVNWTGGAPFCHGRSESMNIDSIASDTEALRAEWGMSAPAALPLAGEPLKAALAFGAGLDGESIEQAEAP